MSAFIRSQASADNIQASSVCWHSRAEPAHCFHFAESGLVRLKRHMFRTSVTSKDSAIMGCDILLLYLDIDVNPSSTVVDKCTVGSRKVLKSKK